MASDTTSAWQTLYRMRYFSSATHSRTCHPLLHDVEHSTAAVQDAFNVSYLMHSFHGPWSRIGEVQQSVVGAQYGEGTLRLTTRQCYQLHGVLKQDLKTVFSSVIKAMGSTLGACGDVNRNVLSPPVRIIRRWMLPVDDGQGLFPRAPKSGQKFTTSQS